MTDKKQPKPFLKRGTGVLSNAQVRSLNQKTRIMQFSDQDPISVPTPTRKDHFEEEVKILVKPRNASFDKKSLNSKQNLVNEQNSNVQNRMIPPMKKKTAGLQDYLSSNKNKNQTQVRSSSMKKRQLPQSSQISSMKLKQQDEGLESDEQQISTENKYIVNHNKNQRFVQNSPNSQQELYNKTHNKEKIPKSNKKKVVEDSDEEQINIVSDDQQINLKQTKISKSFHTKDYQIQQMEATSKQQQFKAPNKIQSKYFGMKAPPQPSSKQVQPLTIQDIPHQLKRQLLNKMAADFAKQIKEKIRDIEITQEKTKKQNSKLEEEMKLFLRQKQKFEKKRQEIEKEHQKKIKIEQEKINREKRYLYKEQTSGKPDFRIKNQVQNLKKKLEEEVSDRKRIQVKYKSEIDRLKKKSDGLQTQNIRFKDQIKAIELERIKDKEYIKQIERGNSRSIIAEKTSNSIQTKNIKAYYNDRPRQSFVTQFFDNDFSLKDLSYDKYRIQSLEMYQYYESIADEKSQLISQECSGQKVNIHQLRFKDDTKAEKSKQNILEEC